MLTGNDQQSQALLAVQVETAPLTTVVPLSKADSKSAIDSGAAAGDLADLALLSLASHADGESRSAATAVEQGSWFDSQPAAENTGALAMLLTQALAARLTRASQPAPQGVEGGSGDSREGNTPTEASISSDISSGASTAAVAGATGNGAPPLAAGATTGGATTVAALPAVAAGANAATNAETASGLMLVDAAGQVIDLSADGNTMVVGAATWCPRCAEFKSQVSTPAATAALEGLNLVFAFGDEGGTGPGGVRNAEFLADLPGQTAFYGEGSLQAPGYPLAFNPATGQFDTHALDAVDAWVAGNWGAAPALQLNDAQGQSLDIAAQANTLVLGVATWCGYCAQLKQSLAAPEVADQLAGLTLVFAFGDEGGAGPGGVQNPDYLSDLPGTVAFLDSASVRPDSFPSAFDTTTGQFSNSAFEAIGSWLANQPQTPPQAAGGVGGASGSTLAFVSVPSSRATTTATAK